MPAHAAARANWRSMRWALVADQIMQVSMKPCEMATKPSSRSPTAENAAGESRTLAARAAFPCATAAALSDCVSTNRPQAAIAGNSPIATAGACRDVRDLKGLRGDDDADPQHDRHAGLDRDQGADQVREAAERQHGEEDGIENRVPRARPERLPTRVADVDGGREARAEHRGDDRAETVDGHARHRRVSVAGGVGRLDVLQRSEHVEQPHRQHHRHQSGAHQRTGQPREEVAQHRHRQVEADRVTRLADAAAVDRRRLLPAAQASQARAVPSQTAQAPPGIRNGNSTPEK